MSGLAQPPNSAGKRPHRVKFRRRQDIPDGAGNQQENWIDLCGPFWARIQPLGGREEVLAQKLAGVQPFEISVLRCAAVAAVTADDQAVNARTGEAYDIVAISNPDERRVELTFLCKAGVATG